MGGCFGRKAKLWLVLPVITVVGVFALEMPVQAKEYSINTISDPRAQVIEAPIIPSVNFGTRDGSDSENKSGDGILLIPRDDAAVNQFGIFHVNALTKRIEMILAF
ncbi:MAG: hypothetical protein HY272_07000 [Gammaproteobacteria bacterium]|nr:hypothetical protein [Gammaproteobacteria bacterium]